MPCGRLTLLCITLSIALARWAVAVVGFRRSKHEVDAARHSLHDRTVERRAVWLKLHPMPSPDRPAGYKLIETGTLVEFEIVDTKVESSPDGETSFVRIALQLGGSEGGDGEGQAEWGAFGVIFTLAALSFNDARPRGYSDAAFVDQDEFTVGDLFDGMSFVRGELHFGADYVRGRCMKTDMVVRRDGQVILQTRARGESALRWVERLRGKKALEVMN